MQLRSEKSLYAMTDLYYRLHWWINNATRDNQPIDNISLEAIKNTRKALEWIINRDANWDQMDLSL